MTRNSFFISSAAGVLSLLDEPSVDLKVFCIKQLNSIVDEFWAEISEHVEKIEILYEEKNFPERNLASLVVSKVYYNLGFYDDSLSFALGAGDMFDIDCKSNYVETIISKSIDCYARLRSQKANSTSVNEEENVDVRLERIVNKMLEKCFEHGQYKQALGIAIETHRMDIFCRSIIESDNMQDLLQYAFTLAMTLVQNRSYRNEILRMLVDLYKKLSSPDYVSICQCFIFLDDASSVTEILSRLISDDKSSLLLVFQIAFDLYDSASQKFIDRVLTLLQDKVPMPEQLRVVIESGLESVKYDAMESTDDSTHSRVSDDKLERESLGEGGGTTESSPSSSSCFSSLSAEQQTLQRNMNKLVSILAGDVPIQMYLQFLIRNNHTDLLVLRQVKDTVRSSVCHAALVTAHGFMQCGTTCDQFLRDNLDWLSRAHSWAKMSATASLGVIHSGHERDALALMQAYLPKEALSGSGYAESGALYALGLIHANHGLRIVDYISKQLAEASTEVVRHGACLGLGLAAMGTQRLDLYNQLKQNMYRDEAVTGEAAGLAMGLVMIGSMCDFVIDDMLAYAHETQHEKIQRGLALGLALMVYEKEEEADSLIRSLAEDQHPVLRRASVLAIACAYCGTASNAALRQLLHVAVSDVDADVRRTAVTAIGFLLYRNHSKCPSVVALLAESYNPHVRYGAAMAMGVACAGTGSREALHVLEPLCHDSVNYVRQGALIGTALVLVQQTESTCARASECRQMFSRVISDKHEDVMAKLGAIYAKGIVDAGGKNVTVALQTRTGQSCMRAVAGMLVFTQHWYWHPLSHFLSLAFSPTCLLALNEQLRMPRMQFVCTVPASMLSAAHSAVQQEVLHDSSTATTTTSSSSNTASNVQAVFGPWPALEEKKADDREKSSASAILSIAAHAKRKRRAERLERMEIEDSVIVTAADSEQKSITDMEVIESPPPEAATKAATVGVVTTEGGENKGADVAMECDIIEVGGASADKKEVGGASVDKKEVGGASADKKEVGGASVDKKEVSSSGASSSDTKPVSSGQQTLSNPARVMHAQLAHISLSATTRYQPVKDVCRGGIIMVRDTRGDTGACDEELVDWVLAHGSVENSQSEEQEPSPPEPFHYDD